MVLINSNNRIQTTYQELVIIKLKKFFASEIFSHVSEVNYADKANNQRIQK